MNSTQNLENFMLEFPKDFVKLGYTTHAKSRLVERTTGDIIVAPTLIRISEKNTTDVKVKDGLITDCTVCIQYKKYTKMYLCVSLRWPNFATVKTVYFKHATKKYKTIKENSTKKAEWLPTPKECIEQRGAHQENVGNVLGNMGGEKTSRWKKLLRAIRRIFGKRA